MLADGMLKKPKPKPKAQPIPREAHRPVGDEFEQMGVSLSFYYFSKVPSGCQLQMYEFRIKYTSIFRKRQGPGRLPVTLWSRYTFGVERHTDARVFIFQCNRAAAQRAGFPLKNQNFFHVSVTDSKHW